MCLLFWASKTKRKEKLRKQQKAPHINKGKGATWEEKPLHQKRKGGVSEDQEGCGQTSQQTSPDWFEEQKATFLPSCTDSFL